MKRRRFLQILASAALPAAFGRPVAAAAWQGVAFGADCSVELAGPGAEAFLATLPARLAQIERLFSLYDPASELSRLNAAGGLADPTPEMRAILTLCDQLHRVTGGRFDPTVQPLWRALADGRETATARAAIGWGRVGLAREVQLGAGQALTLNGIAQGFAADLIRADLAAAGFVHALVNLGEFAALGGPWHLAVADPQWGEMALRSLTGTAIATSCPAATLVGGQSHILDPRGGAPQWSTVSVEADSAAVADGLSTALCLASKADAQAILAQLPGVGSVTLIAPSGDLSTI
jgi:thiamine biosynthesis lipoprotein